MKNGEIAKTLYMKSTTEVAACPIHLKIGHMRMTDVILTSWSVKAVITRESSGKQALHKVFPIGTLRQLRKIS